MRTSIRNLSLIFTLFFGALPLFTHAQAQAPPCRPGTMAAVVGTSCSVGPINFIFGTTFNSGRNIPADIGFILVTTGNQVGFKLIFNFVDAPVNPSDPTGHFLQFAYSVQAAPQSEILAEGISMDASVQPASTQFGNVQVADFQVFPNQPFAVVPSPTIDIENGLTIFNQLSQSVLLEIPGTQSTGNFLGGATTQIFDFAAPGTTASLTSATFLYTTSPVPAPLPEASLSFSNIDLPGVAATFVSNITNSGRTVGSYLDASGGFHAYVAEPDLKFSNIDVPGATSTTGFSLNEHGDVLGDFTDAAGNTHGFLQHDGVITTFDVPNSLITEVGAINDNGQIVGEYESPDQGFHGFLLDHGVFTTIDHGPGTGLFASTGAFGINDAGAIAGFFFDPNTLRSFIQKGSSFQPIDVPGQGDVIVESINNSGDAVGVYNVVFGLHGFLLSQGKYFAVDFPDSNANFPAGINASGKIVGQYTDADGGTHSYLAVPVAGGGSDNQSANSSRQKAAPDLSCSGADWQLRHARRMLAPCQLKH